MAKTYTNLSISISDVFESIVSTVATNLYDDSSVTVLSINYHCETWVELQSRLIKESTDADAKGVRFPLVALIRNFDKDFKGNDGRFDSKLTLIIVTQSTATMLSEDRITTNFIPTLRPIEEELFSVIRTSPYFSGYMSARPPHTSYESFNLGSTDAKSYKLPEYLDGIIIDNLQLKFNPTMVDMYRLGPGVRRTYINNVAELTGQVIGSTFRIGLVDAQYLGDTQPDAITYQIYTPHDDKTVNITVGGSSTLDIAGYTGEFVGYIQCDDNFTVSKLYFYYKLANGVIKKYTSSNKFRLQNQVTTGNTAPYYPFDISTRSIFSHDVINKRLIQLQVDESFTTLETQLYTPSVDDTTEITYTEALDKPTNKRGIQCNLYIDTALNTTTQLPSISYYNLT